MNWIEVVMNPLGLVAYTLALVFGVAGKLAAGKKPWVLPVAIMLAAIVIAGGLFLSYQDVQSKISSAITMPQQKSGTVRQETHGDQSPVVQGVHGDVNIIQNQSGTGK